MSGQEESYNPATSRDNGGDSNSYRNNDGDRHRGYRTSDLRRRDGDDGRRFTDNSRRNDDRNFGPPMRSDRDRRCEPPPYGRDGGRHRSEDQNRGSRWDQPHRFSGDDPSRYRDQDQDYGRYARHPPRERDREYYDDYDDFDGRAPSRSRRYPSDRYHDSMDRHDDDQFRRGRQYSPSRGESPPRRDRSRSNAADMEEPRLPRKKVIEWPPCFEKDGSAFVFHPASGTFYEEQSDFYYDPKTKLYYGVQKQAYYRYEEDDKGEPPFVETQKAEASQGTPALPVELAVTQPSGVSGTSMDTQKPMIAINLKTKKMKKPKHANAASTAPPPPTKAQKEQAANIDKWTEKQAELKSDSVDAVAPSVVRRTVKGDPVCLVCRRKFPNVEKLRLHEEKSELHRTNLAKQQQEVNDKKRAEPPEYHDRAEKRRQLHAPSTIRVQTEEEPASVEPEREALDESHIGNRMLQKMGWKQGSNLGSKGDETANATGTAVDHLRKDWDRIEAMANQQQR